MALVARTRQRDHVLGGSGTLMASCLAEGLPVASACSGQGACGKCLMTVLRGSEALQSASAREVAILVKIGAGRDQRLGCQCQLPDGTEDLLVTTGYW